MVFVVVLANASSSELVDAVGRSEISIVRLLATPDSYHGKRVRVKGFVSIRFEDTAVYLSALDYEWGVLSNAIWLKLPSAAQKLKELDQTYATIVGTFDANKCGHLCLFSGELNKIEEISPASRSSGGAQ